MTRYIREVEVTMKPGQALIAYLSLCAITSASNADTLNYFQSWAALPLDEGDASAAISLAPDDSPYLGVSFVSALDCNPVIVFMSRILYTGHTGPVTIDIPVDIVISGFRPRSYEVATRVMRDNLEILLLRPDDKMELLNEIKEGYSVSIRIDKERTLTRSLRGSKAAISYAQSSCKQSIRDMTTQ